jgi:hypothetical protein
MLKKLIATSILSLFLMNGSLAIASDFTDISSSYWAYKQINALTDEKVISGYPDNTFKPEEKVTREEFATMLVKALNQQSLKVSDILQYLDMHNEMWSYDDVNKINHLKLVVGYPDKTFRPDANITKTEVMVVLSNTLAGLNLNKDEAESVLSIFNDNSSVRDWAMGTVSKSVKNDIYVKYPDPAVLNPNDQATRAEIADLLYKLRKNPTLLAQYRLQDKNIVNVSAVSNEIAAVQHLNAVSTGTSNIVNIKRLTARITEGNVIETAFLSNFTTKKISQNSTVKLVLKNDLYTQEGTFLIPSGSIFEGTVSAYEKAKLFNRNAKVGFDLNKLILPSGKTYNVAASIASKSGLLESGYNIHNFKRDFITTAAVVGTGTVLGMLIGLEDNCGKGAGIGAYSSAGAGVLAAAIVPGYDISFKSGDNVYIKLLKDLDLDR